jgi:hypothetical protein
MMDDIGTIEVVEACRSDESDKGSRGFGRGGDANIKDKSEQGNDDCIEACMCGRMQVETDEMTSIGCRWIKARVKNGMRLLYHDEVVNTRCGADGECCCWCRYGNRRRQWNDERPNR